MPNHPYNLLNLPRRFDLDEQLLHSRFIQACAQCHPDRFIDPMDQAEAAEKSATLNEAYRTLKDPEARANLLLMLLGGPTIEQDKSLPGCFLMDMMEVRERYETALEDGDEATLNELSKWALDQKSEHLRRIAELFRTLTQDDSSNPPLTAESRQSMLMLIRRELNALRYFQRMVEQADRPQVVKP